MRLGNIARVFFLRNKTDFNPEQHAEEEDFQKSSVSVSKIADFRHVDLRGENSKDVPR